MNLLAFALNNIVLSKLYKKEYNANEDYFHQFNVIDLQVERTSLGQDFSFRLDSFATKYLYDWYPIGHF
jgi:hypothetical protein